ncbi:MAG: PKD domain-containing protein [Chitinophagaceae bacterium]|nr:PKD domain-containing protein [Chitinophagaceae bacterium]
MDLVYVESYGYNVGTFVNNLNSYIQIQNTFNTNGQTDTFTCPKTPFRLYIKLAYQANTIHWKLSQVPGLSPNADSIISNPIPVRTEIINGRTYYVYTLQQDFTFASVGTFQIPISYTTSVIENCNQTEYALLTIKVKPGPTGDFTFTTPVCLSDSVYFNGSAGANGYTLTNFLWNFPDNTTANIINPVKKFTTAGANSVRFRVIASNGCLADTTKQVNINDSPVPRLGATSPICQRDSVYITDTSSISSGSITSWRYDFGDGSPALTRATNTPFWHQYLNPGNYTIKLVLNSSLNCKSDTGYKTITVLPKPLAKFGYDRTICAGDSIRFSDSSSTTLGSIVSWKWIFGDGNTEIRTNNAPFYHPYSTPGPYAVSLLVTTGSGCVSDTFKLTVNVVNRPVASISTNIGLPCVDSLRNFASSFTVSGPATWYWNFGDGQTFSSTTSNTAAHAYSAAAANIIVKHVVDLGGGCVSDTATITIPVINPNPVASFGISGNGNSYCKNENISFTSALTGIATWNWNFGNGTGTNTPPFTRSYNTAGPYTLSLQVKDANGCGSLPVTKPITILDIPVAKFGYSGNICVSDSIRLTDTSSTTAGTITQWEWIFGDGNSQIRTNGNPFYHQYTTTGNFTVSLVTVSSNGCKSDTAKRVVSVSSKPSTTFTSFGIPCVDSVRQFTSSFITGAAPATWYWNFGDGQTASSASGNSISHSYSLPGNNVSVKHVVDLGGGCVSDTAIITIPVIHPNPAASFTIIGDTLCTNKPVLFTSGLTGINVWNWQLGDGSSGQQPPFSHIYKTPGTFNISLTVKDINGCGSNQATDQLVINASPAINAGPDKYISTNSSTTLDATIANAGNYSFVWTPGLYLSSTTILNPVCTPDYDPMTYTITAIDNTTFCTGKDYVIITPVSKIYIPTGFTPNNDGKNDKWVIPGLALYPDAVVSIYNRWGEKIFESKNYINNPWTGFYKTLLQPAGAYVYTIQLNDDKKQFYKGTVTLIW